MLKNQLFALLTVSAMRYPKLVIACCAVVVAVASLGLLKIPISADYRVFFSADNPQLLAFEEQESLFNKNDTILFLLEPAGDPVFAPDPLAAIEWLTEEAARLPYSRRVDSVTNFQHSRSEDGVLIVSDLVKIPRLVGRAEAARLERIALDEPALVGRLLSKDGQTTVVAVTVQLPGKDETVEVPAVALAARGLAARFAARYRTINIHVSGVVAFNHALNEATLNDITTMVPIAFAVMVALLILLLRGWVPTVVTVAVIVASAGLACGLAGWLGSAMNTATAAAPIMIMTLAIAHSVHLFVNYEQALQAGKDKQAALKSTFEVNLRPVTLTTVTTVIGFLSMNFSDVPPFRELGNIVAFGIFVSWLFALTLLPAMVTLLPRHHSSVSNALTESSTAMERFGSFVVRRRRWLLWGMLSLTIPLIAMIPRNELNDVFSDYFGDNLPIRQAIEFSAERLGGLETIEYTLDSGCSACVTNAAFIAELGELTDWLRQRPEVVQASSLTDVLKRMNLNLHDDEEGCYTLPEDSALAEQFLTIYELALPADQGLANLVDLDKRFTRLSIILKRTSSAGVQRFDALVMQWLKENAPHIQSDGGNGSSVMFAEMSERNVRSMLYGTAAALVVISLLLIVALRSLRTGLISMVPNLVPALLGFGLWGLFVGQINMAVAVVAGMTLGIVVDDSVHFLSKYQHARDQLGLRGDEAVQYAFRQVGRALFVTTVVLVIGFSVLGLSDFQPTANMGQLTAIVIGMALLADFLLLPPLLMSLERWRNA